MKKVQYCSPKSDYINTCFSPSQLKILATQYNKHFPDKIKLRSKDIISDLDNRLITLLGHNQQYKWPGYLGSLSYNSSIDHIRDSSLMPKKPTEWNNNPNAWLSNLDIDSILEKYSNAEKYQYKYLGTKPIDFAVKQNNTCSFDSDCRVDISALIKNKYKYAGMVLNLDKHNESGSHWVSLFICLDPKSKTYGIYYYDSVSESMPNIVLQYIKDIQQQLFKKYKIKPGFYTNNIQHQYGNNECGMFAICYQIRWLNHLKNNKNTTFQKVINVKINDKIMNEIRNILFRPS